MQSIPREAVPVVIDDNGVEVRLRDEDGLSVGFVRLPAGADLRPATKGLPDDLCPCPHWGYMIKGRVRMHTPDGHQDFAAGEAFYWAPSHAPEALEDSEYVDLSVSAVPSSRSLRTTLDGADRGWRALRTGAGLAD